MAAGDRKIKITQVVILSGNPIPFLASWIFNVEDRVGVDQQINSGQTSGSFGTVAAFNVKTGSQLRTEARTAVIADILNVPPNDSVT